MVSPRFSHSLILAVSATAMLAVSPAWAQKGSFLKPQTEWSVTKAYGQGPGGAGYCALARRYERNTIFTIARNVDQEISVALDFQRAKFRLGQVVEVVLDPGAGQQRQYSVNPVSDKALVMRLGEDSSFFEALNKTGYLRVEVGNEVLNFNLADIDSGESQLQSCVTDLKSGRSVAEAEIKPATSDDLLAQEIQGLRKQIEAMRIENGIQAGIPDVSSEFSVSGHDPQTGQGGFLNLETENRSLKAQLIEKDAAYQRLSSQSVREISALEGQVQAERQRLEAVLAERRSLEASLAHKKQGEGDVTAIVRAENETLKNKLGALTQELATQSTAHERLKLKLQNLEAELSQKDEGKLLQKTLSDKGNGATLPDTMDVSMKSLLSDNARLKAALSEKESLIATLEQHIEEGASSAGGGKVETVMLEKLKGENAILKDRIVSLQDDLRAIALGQVQAERTVTQPVPVARNNESKDEEETFVEASGFVVPTVKPGLLQSGSDVADGWENGKEHLRVTDTHERHGSDALFEDATSQVKPMNSPARPDRRTDFSASVRKGEGNDTTPTPIKPVTAEDLNVQMNKLIARKTPEAPGHVSEILNTPSEAQAQEQKLKASIAGVPEDVSKPALPMGVIDPPTASIASLEGQSVRQLEVEAIEGVSARAPVPPFESHILDDEDLSEYKVSEPAAGRARAASTLPAPEQSKLSPSVVESILADAGIPVGSFETIHLASETPGQRFYQWQSGIVYGSSEQRPLSKIDDFPVYVREYLEKTESRCNGDFAISPDKSIETSEGYIESYEVACVSPEASSSASLVFFNQGRTFTVFAHEAPIEEMTAAMDIRDRLFRTLSES